MKERSSAPIIVVGSGLAGYSLIREFRRLGGNTPIILITQDEGSFYPKPQLSAALGNGKSADQIIMKSAGQMAEDLRIEIRTQETVTAIDPKRRRIKLQTLELEYSQLVLALGAKPRSLQDFDHSHLSVNNLDEYRTFRSSLTGATGVRIVGTGLVGCEFAHDLARSGHSVKLWGPGDCILQGLLPTEPAKAVEQALREEGVVRIAAQDTHLGQYAAKAQEENEILLTAIGLEPCTQLACAAELEVGKGIKVDLCLRSSDPNIYALGDCAEVDGRLYQYIQPIGSQARLLARVLMDESVKWEIEPWPVTIKVPGNPLVIPPPLNLEGAWHLEGESLDWRGYFVDEESRVRGLLLMGGAVRERTQALAKLNQIF